MPLDPNIIEEKIEVHYLDTMKSGINRVHIIIPWSMVILNFQREQLEHTAH